MCLPRHTQSDPARIRNRTQRQTYAITPRTLGTVAHAWRSYRSLLLTCEEASNLINSSSTFPALRGPHVLETGYESEVRYSIVAGGVFVLFPETLES